MKCDKDCLFMQISDSIICNLLKHHDEKGMELLFARYYKPLVVWASTFLNDLSRSEDLVQDFFVKLWEKSICCQLKPQTLQSFLYTSVRNLAFDQMEKRDPLKNASNIRYFDREWEEYDTFEEEIYSQLKCEIERLPNRSREVITCIYLQGLSYKDTAQKLGITVATVNSLLVNALKKIRRNCSDSQNQAILLFLLADENSR